MSEDNPITAALGVAQIVQITGAPAGSIQDVIDKMTELDGLLAPGDGVKWFNLLYLKVTEGVRTASAGAVWLRPAWLERLDVVFANLYFTALGTWHTNRPSVSRAWAALFNARSERLLRLQFALAGMNAHINHDLPLALVQTCAEMGVAPEIGSPEHADFQAVNNVLEVVEPIALKFLATGVIGEAMEDMKDVAKIVSMWSIRAARDVAWDNGMILRHLRDDPTIRETYLNTMDRATGRIGTIMLTQL